MTHWSFFVVFDFACTKLGYAELGEEVNRTEDVMFVSFTEYHVVLKYS